jgi:hypothetical protein
MLERLFSASTLALVAAFGLTGVLEAAKGPDAADVALGTGGAVLGLMAFLVLVYGIRRALGGGGALPPEEPAADAGHH